jgi:hypothetical protein
MIGYNDFSKLRLANFLSKETCVNNCAGYQFMGDVWTGQTVGFTECLQLQSNARDTQSISLDLNGLDSESINKIIALLGLDIYKGMEQEQVIETFGTPLTTERFMNDRQTFIYIVGNKEQYYLSLTIHQSDGLIYVTMMNHADTINQLADNHSDGL